MGVAVCTGVPIAPRYVLPSRRLIAIALMDSATRGNGRVALGRGQIRVQGRYHLRALTHRGRNPLDRTRAHVTDSKHAFSAGLQRPQLAGRVRAGQDEPLCVQSNA
jgi:hypothetical protein